jgi:hypothetical protein
VANQIIVALNIAAVGEALVFASKAGADPAKVRQALMGGFASSRILEVHGERMIKRTFNPGFRIGLHQKDLVCDPSDHRSALRLALAQAISLTHLLRPPGRLSPHPARRAGLASDRKSGYQSGYQSWMSDLEHPTKSTG